MPLRAQHQVHVSQYASVPLTPAAHAHTPQTHLLFGNASLDSLTPRRRMRLCAVEYECVCFVVRWAGGAVDLADNAAVPPPPPG